MVTTKLTDNQKQALYQNGYIVIKNAVPERIVKSAKKLVSESLPNNRRRLLVPAGLATDSRVIALFNETCLIDLLHNEIGPFPEVISCQVAITPGHDKIGGHPGPHVDGSWGGTIPTSAEDIDLVTGRPKDPIPYFGENDDLRGSNDGQLWQDPEHRISLGSYTALVGIALNDQNIPGNGQFGVLKGMHHLVESEFRRQRDSGSVIGPEGLGWPRIKIRSDGTPFLNGLFDRVRMHAAKTASQNDAIMGWPWRELTPVCLQPGDAVIALHACPHTATPNYGPDPRMNIYFRIRRQRQGNPHEGSRRLGHGVSDHLDRGYFGQFLNYPDDYDPWQISVEKLCDHWSDWDGMQNTVALNRSES